MIMVIVTYFSISIFLINWKTRTYYCRHCFVRSFLCRENTSMDCYSCTAISDPYRESIHTQHSNIHSTRHRSNQRRSGRRSKSIIQEVTNSTVLCPFLLLFSAVKFRIFKLRKFLEFFNILRDVCSKEQRVLVGEAK